MTSKKLRIDKQRLGRVFSFLALGAVLVGAVAGCGGGTTNGDAEGSTPSSYPYIYGYGDNVLANEVSALGTGSASNPAASDVLYFTFASGNSLPNNTLPGAGPFVSGLSNGASGTFAPSTVIPAAAPGGTYIFRAQGAQGQVGHTLEDITTASLTAFGSTAAFSFALNTATADGPFNASGYVAPVTIPSSSTSGVYPITATITDKASHSTTTTFQTVVLTSGDAAIASASSLTIPGVTPIAAYGPDADGDTVLIVPAGSYTPTVGGTPLAAPVTLASGTVTVE